MIVSTRLIAENTSMFNCCWRSEVKCDYLTTVKVITSSIPTGIFRYFIITCLDSNVHVSAHTWLWPYDYNMSEHKCVWVQTCMGTNVSGHKRMWAQSNVGTNVSGHKRVWAQSCVGTIVWAQVCMGTNVWSSWKLSINYSINNSVNWLNLTVRFFVWNIQIPTNWFHFYQQQLINLA